MESSFLVLVVVLVLGIGVGAVGFLEVGGPRVARAARWVFYLFVAMVVIGLFLGLLTDAARVSAPPPPG
jgi:hypothetical protein